MFRETKTSKKMVVRVKYPMYCYGCGKDTNHFWIRDSGNDEVYRCSRCCGEKFVTVR